MIATLLLALVVVLGPLQTSAADAARVRLAGRPLAEALQLLESRGLKVIFSTDLVRPEMCVKEEPKASRPRRILDEILAPHGLAVHAGPRDTLLVVAAARARPARKPAAEGAPPQAPPVAVIPPESKPGSDPTALRFKETVDVPSSPIADAPHSAIAVPSAQVNTTAGGLENVFHTLQLLPGVTATSDFGSRLSVRGGGPDQNLIVMDNFEIHNPYRLFGLVSGINSETVDRFEFFAGPFSARYGDRLSSLLVIDTRDGSATRKIQGSANVSLTDANIVLEGRLPGRRRGSWLITGRRTYYDLIVERLSDVKKLPGFTDAQLKAVWEPGPGQRVTVHGLLSRESMDLSTIDSLGNQSSSDLFTVLARTRTAFVAADWVLALGARAHLRSGVSFSSLTDAFDVDANGCVDTRRSNTLNTELPCITPLAVGHDLQVRDLTLREQLTLTVGRRQSLDAGVEVHGLRSRLSVASAGEDFPVLSLPGLGMLGIGQLPWHDRSGPFDSSANAARVGAWLEDRFQATSSLFVAPGLRLDHVASTGETLFAPRVAAALSLTRAMRLRASAGLHYQSPGYDKAFLGGSSFALDLSSPLASGLRSERAMQVVFGIERDFGPEITVRLEAYRRRLDRLIVGRLETEAERQARLAEYDFPVAFQSEIPLEPLITRSPSNEGAGQASGLELFLLKKPASPATRLTGWLSYSYGKADREAYGIRYPFDYDRRHALSLAGQLKASSWLMLSGSAQAASGVPTTLPPAVRVARIEDVGDVDRDRNVTEWIPYRDIDGALAYEVDFGRMDGINSTRLSAAVRVDVRATFRPRGTSGRWLFYLDVINVLNRRNKLSTLSNLTFDPAGDRPRLENVFAGGFPIVPTFGVKVRF